jgi:hypothetical protein
MVFIYSLIQLSLSIAYARNRKKKAAEIQPTPFSMNAMRAGALPEVSHLFPSAFPFHPSKSIAKTIVDSVM